jgi:predicted nucleotidyltransferase
MNPNKLLIFNKQNVYNYLTPKFCMLEQIFSKSNIQIIKEIIKKDYSVRDLAKKTGLSPAKITQFIHLFEKQKIIITKKEKNTKKIVLNIETPITREILSLIIFEQITNTKSLNKLKQISNYIGVYGSTCTGNIDSKSDIDLFIITKNKIDSINQTIIKNEIEKEIEKKVDLKSFTKQEFEKLKEEDPIFFQQLNNSKTIWGRK